MSELMNVPKSLWWYHLLWESRGRDNHLKLICEACWNLTFDPIDTAHQWLCCAQTHMHTCALCKNIFLHDRTVTHTCTPACAQTQAAQNSHNLRNVPQGSVTQWSRKWEGPSGNGVETIEQLCECVNTHIKTDFSRGRLASNLARAWQNQEARKVA